MYAVHIPKVINLIMESYYRFGLWSRGEVPSVKEIRIKLLYSLFHLLFLCSLIVGAYNCEDNDEAILLTQLGFVIAVLSVKFLYLIWKQNDILSLVDQIGEFSVPARDQYVSIDGKLRFFDKIVKWFIYLLYFVTFCITLIAPFVSGEKRLFYDIAFPLDYKNNEFAFWIAFTFLACGIFVSTFPVLFTFFMVYVMFCCVVRIETLGNRMQTMGISDDPKVKQTKVERQESFDCDFRSVLEGHAFLKELETTWHKYVKKEWSPLIISFWTGQ